MSLKPTVLVLYGGRSTEHEVSCRSAAFVLRHLNPEKYHIRAVGIDKSGAWLPQNTPHLLANLPTTVPIEQPVARKDQPALPTRTSGHDPAQNLLGAVNASSGGTTIADLIVFPVLHGTFGEDGSLQGMLDLMGVAYVGPDTLGSAVGMDKIVAKKLVAAAGVPVVPFLETKRQYWTKHQEAIGREAASTLGFPLFVKPARLGSSVGIAKVNSADGLKKACENALSFDDKILLEKGMVVREIECAVLGDYDPKVSIPGEVIPHADFYTYDAKYIDAGGASMAIPAELTPAQALEAQALSKKVFQALELYGMARVDLFLEKSTGKFYFNEVNTIPGFTPVSQYPLLWQASGVPPEQLIDELINLAVARRKTKESLIRSK